MTGTIPTGARILVRGATLLTIDDQQGPLIPEGDILIEDGEIIEIGVDLHGRLADDGIEVIDASSHYVLPGFVDTHRHCWQNQLRRIIPNGDLGVYREISHVQLAEQYAPEDMYVGNLISALGALDAGITCLVDWSHNPRSFEHAQAAVAGLRTSGIRAVHAFSRPTINPGPSDEYRDMFIRLQEEEISSEGLVSLAIGSFVRNIHESSTVRQTTQQSAPLDASGDIRFARDRGVRITFDGVQGPTGSSGVIRLAQEGLLDSDITYVHCNALSDEAWTRIADSGGTISVAATSEMQLGIGNAVPAVQDALDQGIRPSLSADVEVALSGDMFSQMRAVLSAQRADAHRRAQQRGSAPDLLKVEDVLEFATREGARAVGLEPEIGTITPGARADLIFIRRDDINTMPGNSPAGTVVLAADPRNIEIVLVNGEVVKWDRELVGVDLPKLRAEVEESRDRVLARGGFELHRQWREVVPENERDDGDV